MVNLGLEIISFLKTANSRAGSGEVSVESSHLWHILNAICLTQSITIFRNIGLLSRVFLYPFVGSLLKSFQREKAQLIQNNILWHIFIESIFSNTKKWLVTFSLLIITTCSQRMASGKVLWSYIVTTQKAKMSEHFPHVPCNKTGYFIIFGWFLGDSFPWAFHISAHLASRGMD